MLNRIKARMIFICPFLCVCAWMEIIPRRLPMVQKRNGNSSTHMKMLSHNNNKVTLTPTRHDMIKSTQLQCIHTYTIHTHTTSCTESKIHTLAAFPIQGTCVTEHHYNQKVIFKASTFFDMPLSSFVPFWKIGMILC